LSIQAALLDDRHAECDALVADEDGSGMIHEKMPHGVLGFAAEGAAQIIRFRIFHADNDRPKWLKSAF
jgi:hypothetical protein